MTRLQYYSTVPVLEQTHLRLALSRLKKWSKSWYWNYKKSSLPTAMELVDIIQEFEIWINRKNECKK